MNQAVIPAPVARPIPRRLSPSALEKFRGCPKAFEYQYVLKAEGEDRPSPILVTGNAVHHALERFFGLPVEDRTVDVLHQALRSVWPEHRNPEAFINRDEEAEAGLAALAMLTQFAETEDLTVRPRSREDWASLNLPNGVQVFGKVDRVDLLDSGGLAVIDYKTGKRTLPKKDLPGNVAAQVYSLAVQDRYRKPVEEFRLLYLALGKTLTWRPTPEEMEQARERLIELTSDVRATEHFVATPGDACRFCNFAHICPDKDRVEVADLQVTEEVPF